MSILASLFETIKRFVLDDGGDGDACVVCPRYRELADRFEAYEKSHGDWFTERIELPNSITFAHDQEWIRFIPRQPVPSVGKPSITVEILGWTAGETDA